MAEKERRCTGETGRERHERRDRWQEGEVAAPLPLPV